MAEQQAKLIITTDASGAITGIKQFQKELHKTQSVSEDLAAKVKANWIASAAAIGTAMIAINKAWSMLKDAAGYEEQMGVLNNLTAKYKTTADAIVRDMKRASDGMISNADLMQVALSGIAKGLNPQQLINLADAAKILADTTGGTTTEALKNLTLALETGRTKGLVKMAGTTIDLGVAFGDLESKMTATQKAQAMYALTMIYVAGLQKQQKKAVDDTADTIEKIEAKYNNLGLSVSRTWKAIVVSAIEGAVGMADLYSMMFGKKGTTGPGVYDVPPIGAGAKEDPAAEYKKQIAELKKLLQAQSDNTQATKDWEKAQKKATDKAIEETRKASHEAESIGKSQFEKDIARINAEGAAFSAAQVDDVIVYKWAKAQMALADAKQLEENIKSWQKAETEAVTAMATEVDRGVKETEEKIKLRQTFNEFSIKSAADLLSDTEGRIQEAMDMEAKRYTYINDLVARGVITHIEAEEEKRKATERRIKSEREITSNKWMKDNQDQQQVFSNLATCFDTAAQLYAEDSKERQALSAISKAATIAEIALQVQKNLMIAVGAVVQQGTGDPYTAFARIAAMIAVVTGVLSIVGIAFSGGASSGVSSASTLPKSTVLGAADGTGSNSISNSYKLMQDTYDMTDTRLSKIYNALQSLSSSTLGLVSNLVRFGAGSTSNWQTDDEKKGWADAFFSGSWLSDLLGIGDYDLLGKITSGLTRWIGGLFGSVFGGKKSQYLAEAGIDISAVKISDLIKGLDVVARAYGKIITKTDGGWFKSDSYDESYQYSPLEKSIINMFTKVYKNLGTSLVELSKGLGTDVNAALNYVFGDVKIDLLNKTGEEINKALNDYFSKIADDAAEKLFGSVIGTYQRVGEGLYETAVRLVQNKAIVESVLKLTGQTFEGTIPQVIKFSESLIEMAGGLEKLTDAASAYYDKFFTDAEKQARLKTSLGDVFKENKLPGGVPDTREAYRSLLEGLDLTTDSGKEAYIILLKLAETADAYYSYLEKVAEQRADMEMQLLELTGTAAEILAAKRKKELDAMDETLRPLQELIWLTQDWADKIAEATKNTTSAIDEQISLSKTASGAARSAADAYKKMIDTLTDAQIKINGGGATGAQGRFDTIFSKAMTGDREALGALPGSIDGLLANSLKTSKTAEDYARDQGKSLLALEDAKTISGAMVNWEEYQATLLETQTTVLEQIKDELSKPNPDLVLLEKQAGLLETIGTLLSQQVVQIAKGNSDQILLMHDQTGKIVQANILTRDQTGQIILGDSWLAGNIAQVTETINAGIKIKESQAIAGYLDKVSSFLAFNNSAEAEQARAQIAILRATTADGFISTTEAKPTQDALALLRELTRSLGVSQINGIYYAQAAGAVSAQQALDAIDKIDGSIGQANATIGGQTAEIINGNLIIRDQTGLIISGNKLITDQTGKISIGNALTGQQTAQVATGVAIQDAIKNISELNKDFTESMLTALIGSNDVQNNSLQGILEANNKTVSLIRTLIQLTITADKEKMQAVLKGAQSDYLVALSKMNKDQMAYSTAKGAWWDAQDKKVIADANLVKAQQDLIVKQKAYDDDPGVKTYTSPWGNTISEQEYQVLLDYYKGSEWMLQGWTENIIKDATITKALADAKALVETSKTAVATATAAVTAAAASVAPLWDAYQKSMGLFETAMWRLNELQEAFWTKYPEERPIPYSNPVPDSPHDKAYPTYGFADGGISTGPESGYEARLHGTELVISPRNGFPATVKGTGNVISIEDVREIKALLRDLKTETSLVKKHSKTTADVIQRVTRDGESMLTEAV